MEITDRKPRFVATEDLNVSGMLKNKYLAEAAAEQYGHTFKVRAANTDTKAGQSNRYRIIYYAVRADEEIHLLTIYYKKDDNRIPTNQEIISLVENYCM